MPTAVSVVVCVASKVVCEDLKHHKEKGKSAIIGIFEVKKIGCIDGF